MHALAFCLLLVSGCSTWLSAPVPMRSVEYNRPGPLPTCLVVLLPGAGDSAETFARRGVVSALLERGYSLDVVAADATLGYYAQGIFSDRLATDVIRRRFERGYKELWLIGTSIGGFGTLLYARQRQPGEVTGVLALSPLFGSDPHLLSRIRAQSLARWDAPQRADELDISNYESELWRWLQAVTAGREVGPELYLGYALDERLAEPNSLLAAVLDSRRVYLTEGGHGWESWKVLLERFLDHGPLAARCR